MQRHQWREQTEEGILIYRAEYHASRWCLMTQLKGAEEWDMKEELAREDWEKLREVLWNKYQRKRCPWELVDKIDQRLEAMDEAAGKEGE